ncbi:MAG TPA: acetyl-coenzyme A synthetase N-terminal domain-containing protein, partial [Nocardioides sp.]|nr:acetyl-coenzyme A synthetase N-terminal domain-containing protein [Nocardioides sp.]
MSEPELLRPVAPDVRATTEIGRFLTWLQRERGLTFAGYEELHRWSVDDLDGFWSALWEHFGVRGHSPYDAVLGRREMPGAEWFPGATLNYAEHALGLLDNPDQDADETAVLGYS